jgi:hypothetical protein
MFPALPVWLGTGGQLDALNSLRSFSKTPQKPAFFVKNLKKISAKKGDF